jgi:monofunctional glycosyltransferase
VSEEPEIVVEPRRMASRRRRRGRGFIRTWLRRGAFAVVVVALLPLLLTLVYAVPGVRPVSTLMVKDIVTLQGYDRRWVPLEEMGPRIIHAVMMSEDGQFCRHRGVDVGEFRALLEEALAGEATRGGSTITMQTVKNLYLWHGRSYVRKAIELPLAIYFDAVLSKKRIMEIYLNIAEWAPGVYGVEAGAWHYFNRPARELTARQAALMAVTLPNPAARNPANPTANLNRVANTIERRARGAGGYVGCLQ